MPNAFRTPARFPLRWSALAGRLAAAVLGVAAAVLAGWWRGIPVLKSILPGSITMKPNTAVSFALLATAVLLVRREPVPTLRRLAAAVPLVAVAAIAAITLCEYLLDTNLGIDELLFRDADGRGRFPPGRLAPITAVNFLLLSVAVGLSHLRRRPSFRAAQLMVLLAFLVGFQGFVGYLLGTTYTFGFAYYTQMAVHTTALFAASSLAILASRPDRGLMEIVTSDTAGGVLSRNLIGWALVVPPVVGFVALLGERAHLYDANFTTLLRVVGNTVFFTVLVWRNAVALHRIDLDRRSTERARERLYDEAQRAVAARDEAIRARDEFLSLASHELKTPLTSLRLRLDQLRRSVARADVTAVPATAVREATGRFERFVGRLAALVESLLEASRISAGELRLVPEPARARDLVDRGVKTAADALERARCPVAIDVPDDLEVVGDPARLVHVLVLLLANAATHAPGRPVTVRGSRASRSVRIEVRDGGPGIPADAHERIFQRFERASSEQPASGLGLGLYLARQIARAHGGDLSVRSDAGGGATFALELPARPTYAVGPPLGRAHDERAARGGAEA